MIAAFHAAAYKQVPLLEAQLREAVRNNVLATETVARACRAAGVGTFVLISTDKAVDPVNVLGATKRLAEMTCQALADQRKTRFVTVRFGNVLDSAGSVVPLFREQIRAGGPVTVTDPEVTRFFMTIPEACQLILQASAIGTHEAIYTLDMGEPVPIRLLAEQMIRLAGKQPGRDVAIVYTGLRPGEKLHETLFHADERYRPTVHPKILQAEPREVTMSALEHPPAPPRAASERNSAIGPVSRWCSGRMPLNRCVIVARGPRLVSVCAKCSREYARASRAFTELESVWPQEGTAPPSMRASATEPGP